MSAFDDVWWDRRTQTKRSFDVAAPSADARRWAMFRFADGLLQRYYRTIGLEPGLSVIGAEYYQLLLWSPSCRRSPVIYGRFCGSHAHTAVDALGFLEPYLGPQQSSFSEGCWPTWDDFMSSAIASLGLRGASTSGHQACFHRRGVAILPDMFRIAVLLRTEGAPTVAGPFASGAWLASYPPDLADISPDLTSKTSDLLRPWPDVLAASWPQCVLLLHEGVLHAALRGNGRVLLRGSREIDAGALLQSGATVVEVADIIRRTLGLPGRPARGSTADWASIRPLARPIPIRPPDRIFSSADLPKLADPPGMRICPPEWTIVLRGHRLHISIEATEQPIFEAGLVDTGTGWLIADLSVEGDLIPPGEVAGEYTNRFLHIVEERLDN